MAIYIRHANDRHTPGVTSKHDTPLTDRGKSEARETALVLQEMYGAPAVIVCSPYMRARQTAEHLVKALDACIPIVIDNQLSKYVTSSNLRDLDVRNDTLRHAPPIRESKSEFKQRVYKHFQQFVVDPFHKQESRDPNKMVWYVTHGIFVRTIAVDCCDVPAPHQIDSCNWINALTKISSWGLRQQAPKQHRRHAHNDDHRYRESHKHHSGRQPARHKSNENNDHDNDEWLIHIQPQHITLPDRPDDIDDRSNKLEDNKSFFENQYQQHSKGVASSNNLTEYSQQRANLYNRGPPRVEDTTQKIESATKKKDVKKKNPETDNDDNNITLRVAALLAARLYGSTGSEANNMPRTATTTTSSPLLEPYSVIAKNNNSSAKLSKRHRTPLPDSETTPSYQQQSPQRYIPHFYI